MMKEVLLTMQGLQFDQQPENAEQIETVTVADYYKKNDKISQDSIRSFQCFLLFPGSKLYL